MSRKRWLGAGFAATILWLICAGWWGYLHIDDAYTRQLEAELRCPVHASGDEIVSDEECIARIVNQRIVPRAEFAAALVMLGPLIAGWLAAAFFWLVPV
jgi:hypothetical protein